MKLVLAIARTGSLTGAGRKLGLSHATVFRHLNSVEKTLGVSLFRRDARHYTTTAAGEALTATAADVETKVLDVEQRLNGQELELAGTVRVTTTDTLMSGLLAPVLTAFQAKHPDIIVELSVSNTVFSLSRRDADVAIRPGQNPNENLVGRRIGVIQQAAYTALDQTSDRAAETNPYWIGIGADAGYSELEIWMREQGLDSHCRLFTNSSQATYAAVISGAGNAILPCYLGDSDPRLRRLSTPIPELASDLWLLAHPEFNRIAPIKVFNDFVFATVRERLQSLQEPL